MELALVIGIFVAISVLVALCTFWFFNLHRSYLVLAAKGIYQNPAEDDDASSDRLNLALDDSEEDRGEKFFLVGGSVDDQKLPLSGKAEDGEKSSKVISPSITTREKGQMGTAELSLESTKKKLRCRKTRDHVL